MEFNYNVLICLFLMIVGNIRHVRDYLCMCTEMFKYSYKFAHFVIYYLK